MFTQFKFKMTVQIFSKKKINFSSGSQVPQIYENLWQSDEDLMFFERQGKFVSEKRNNGNKVIDE